MHAAEFSAESGASGLGELPEYVGNKIRQVGDHGMVAVDSRPSLSNMPSLLCCPYFGYPGGLT